MEETTGFKRLHFFKMFLTEHDWNARHQFHFEKHEFHNRVMHGTGVIPYEGEGLLVTQRPRAEMAVEVRPGHAIDPQGRDLLIKKATILRVERESQDVAQTLYVIAKMTLEPIRFVRFKSGRRVNRYFEETPEVSLVDRPPIEADGEIELGRIRLSPDAEKIYDPEDAQRPKTNEIDMRHRHDVRVSRSIDGTIRQRLLAVIRDRRRQFQLLAGNTLLRPALASFFFLGVLEMIVMSDVLTPKGIIRLLDGFGFCDEQTLKLIEGQIDDPWVQQRPEFLEYSKGIDLVRNIVGGPWHRALSDLEQIISFSSRSGTDLNGLTELYGNDSLVFKEGQAVELSREYPMGEDWDHLKVWSGDMPPTMIVDGLEWQMVDRLEIMDEKSELSHKFRISGAKKAWKARQRLSFPDGTMVDGVGVAHEGGFSEFTIRNVIPDTELAIIRMMDFARGDYEIEVYCNDKFVGISRCDGSDQTHRWRNWPFVIPAIFVNDETVTIKQVMATAERDVNMFKYWFYQPAGW